MTEARKYTAHINRKGLDATGVTEDHARSMAAKLGGSTMLIVEAKHLTVTTDAEGNVKLALALTGVEPVPAHLDERVREFQRALYRTRPDQEGQRALSGVADGTSPEDALGDVTATIERDDTGAVTGVWDGNTDGPLETPEAAKDGTCDYPGCFLPAEHDGDHQDAGS